VRLRAEDKATILDELLCIPSHDKQTRASVIDQLEGDLSLHFNLLRKLPDRPLPAHLIAEMVEVQGEVTAYLLATSALVHRLKYRLTTEAMTRLFVPVARNPIGLSPAEVGFALEISDANFLISRLAGRVRESVEVLEREDVASHGGAKNQREKMVRDAVGECLREFYCKTSREQDEGSEADFVAVCEKYLPSTKSGRPRRKTREP
jgi:hypothetical protein